MIKISFGLSKLIFNQWFNNQILWFFLQDIDFFFINSLKKQIYLWIDCNVIDSKVSDNVNCDNHINYK